ncbi:tripartite tricarboxylate transporter permease [Metabacillus endolithicus]|nr:tripartite tricarboxylate transporter permease [Metabacillus endolithicus]UPG62519.1 tripartite tricarboxylate transporter permease [Metabacillus endolithicus]
MDAKRSSKHPEKFGKGYPGGLAVSDSANNAAVGGALIPLIAIGIPGSATMAIIMGAFIIHGLQPGPRIFVENMDLLAAMFWGFLSNLYLYVFYW